MDKSKYLPLQDEIFVTSVRLPIMLILYFHKKINFTERIQAIYHVLSYGNPMSLSEINAKTPYCHRSVHEALRFLEREKIITKSPDLHDMRRFLYQATTFSSSLHSN